MASFDLRQNPISQEWSIISPRRAKRPDKLPGQKFKCPFCPGKEKRGFKELYRLGGGKGRQPGWKIRVIPNDFPYAPICELIIHSSSHSSDFFNFSSSHIAKIIKVYQQRYQIYERIGQVLIFHNHGHLAGESIPHSHTQLTVLPKNFLLDIPQLGAEENVFKKTKYFQLFCPCHSSWPDEVWIAPRQRGRNFGEVTNAEIADLAECLQRVLKKMERLIEKNFPFNFYIYPGSDWYLRIIPRKKQLGGFEVATGVFVNTSEPEITAKRLVL